MRDKGPPCSPGPSKAALTSMMKAGLSFVSASVEQSGPTNLLDSQLMRMEAETGYTCDITLSALIFEAIFQEEGKCDESAEQVRESNRHARGNPSSDFGIL